MGKPSLTQRELDVLQLVAQGRSNKDIARRLAITEGTAKTHVKAILTKLDAISRRPKRWLWLTQARHDPAVNPRRS